jgi:hypothetical protein
MKKFSLGSLLGLALLFTACEGGTEFEKHITNNSDSEITFIFFNNFFNSTDTILVGANSSETYYSGGGERTFVSDYTCLWEIDSVHVQIDGNKTLKKDPADIDQWEMESRGKNYTIHTCKFVIEQEDVE